MEATSHLSPAITLDTMSSPQFLKPEDLYTDASPSPAYEGDGSPLQSATMQTSPQTVVVHSKPAKKRKSWGQALPEPKTTLPPRKRAKTDDEKEQRRIERIKRNRAAAHNSRERKRQETETLAVALARANAELNAYRDLHGPLPAHIKLPEVTISTDAETPAPSLSESYGTQEPETSPETPPQYESTITTIKEEPTETTLPCFPPAFDNLDLKSSLSLLDPTQHSAAMLCDLQCRSSAASSTTNMNPASTTSTSLAFWASLFLQLMTLQFQACYKTILLALWTTMPSRMARLIQASTLRSTSRSTTSSTTPLLLRSMAMARSRAATGRLSPQQGALGALRRLPVGEANRARVQAAAARQYLVYQRRKAYGEHSGSEPNGNGNEKGGV